MSLRATHIEPEAIQRFANVFRGVKVVVVGAGEGLSASAGFTCAGERFAHWFRDFGEKYGFSDMCTGGFYPFHDAGEYWAYWSRYIMANRYMNPPKPVYNTLLELLRDKDYFVLTTNVDHCFQKAGFDKKRLFYTQGDYGLFQCSEPCRQETWDNERVIREMFERQRNMRVPPELIPRCPHCGKPVALNLRADDTFVEDAGWQAAARRYSDFLHKNEGRPILFLELGVGYNTPVIIKYPFWRMTYENPSAFYACVNSGETMVPDNIEGRSVRIDGDIGEALEMLRAAL